MLELPSNKDLSSKIVSRSFWICSENLVWLEIYKKYNKRQLNAKFTASVIEKPLVELRFQKNCTSLNMQQCCKIRVSEIVRRFWGQGYLTRRLFSLAVLSKGKKMMMFLGQLVQQWHCTSKDMQELLIVRLGRKNFEVKS